MACPAAAAQPLQGSKSGSGEDVPPGGLPQGAGNMYHGDTTETDESNEEHDVKDKPKVEPITVALPYAGLRVCCA